MPEMRVNMRGVVIGIVALMLITAGLPTTRASPTSQGRYGGTFVFAQGGEPEHLNPALIPSSLTINGPAPNIYNSLVRQNLDLSLRPDLAETWSVSTDGLVYTFNLAKNVPWHDGQPFTSADVKFTVEEVLLKFNSQAQSAFTALRVIEIPDPSTVVFRLKRPFPLLLQYLEFSTAPILPRHLYQGTDALRNPHNSRPVGTGPFKLQEWVRGSHLTLVRNENYFKRGLPYLDRVVVRVIPDPNARLVALEAGEADYVSGYFAYSEYERLGRKSELEMSLKGTERTASIANNLAFNLRHQILKDVRVRRAIAHAIDKKFIVEKSAFGIGRIATGHISSQIAWAHNPRTPSYAFDQAKANQMLDEAGYPKRPDGTRFSVRLSWSIADAEHAKSAEIIAQHLRAVGIDVQLQPLEAGAWRDAVFIRWEFDMTMRGIGTGPDPSISAFWRSYYSPNILRRPLHNFMGYRNLKVDDLFAKALFTMDQKKRAEYFYEVQTIMMQDLPSIPIRERAQASVWRRDFDGDLPAGPFEGIINGFENVWWRKGRPQR
ncbi:MAG: ABC transporter substrate-binding protein [Armatimonadota bacterium]